MLLRHMDGIVLELLTPADYFITTKEAISSKGIDYMETFGGQVLSGLEYDVFNISSQQKN